MTRRLRQWPGFITALTAVIFGLGSVTASYACSRDAGAVVAVHPPTDDDCAGHTMAGSCARSCLAICHAIVPATSTLDQLAFTPEARLGTRIDSMLGLAFGPEPPPPRMA